MRVNRTTIILFSVLLSGSWNAAAQSTAPSASVQDRVFNVVQPTRPLLAAAGLLGEKLGVPVSYEDPIWASSDDLISAKDLPESRQRAAEAPDLEWPMIPKGGALEIHIPINTITMQASESPLVILERTVQDSQASGIAGEFKVVAFGEGEFSIVPSRAKDRTGKLVPQTSPFDTRISLPREVRKVPDVLGAIFDAIKQAGGGSVSPLLLPTEWIGKQEVFLSADNEPARDVLSRAFREAQWSDLAYANQPRAKMSYRLRYDIRSKTYVVNIYLVMREVAIRLDQGPGPISSNRTELVYW